MQMHPETCTHYYMVYFVPQNPRMAYKVGCRIDPPFTLLCAEPRFAPADAVSADGDSLSGDLALVRCGHSARGGACGCAHAAR